MNYTKAKLKASDSGFQEYKKHEYVITDDEEMIIIATVYGKTEAETEANTRLIAAAPKMVNLLERLVNNGWNADISEAAKEILNTIH